MPMFEKTKKHFKENKKVYFACAGTAAITAVGTIFLVRRTSLVLGDQTIVQALSWRPEAWQTIEVHIEALGDPGNIIQDTVTGSVYASQGQIAKELGVTPVAVSRHLNGHTEHVGGHKLVRLGKAHVAE